MSISKHMRSSSPFSAIVIQIFAIFGPDKRLSDGLLDARKAAELGSRRAMQNQRAAS